jgi:hypothetical protein
MRRSTRVFRDRGPADPTRDPIVFAVELQTAECRRRGMGDDAIRVEIIGRAKYALEGGEVKVRMARFHGEPDPLEVVDGAGLFRVIFTEMGLDRHDLVTQEALFARIERATAATLGRN